METIYSPNHVHHRQTLELGSGELLPAYELPERVEAVLSAVQARALGPVTEPRTFGRQAPLRLHDSDYLEFLETAWADWSREGHTGQAIPTVWPSGGRLHPVPERIEGRLGRYAFAAETAITPGTWDAALTAVDVALTAQERIGGGARSAFALVRPPGHHASAGLFGGYCYCNNAALAAQAFLDDGATRVALLDVDFHHGNGTQSIFYQRDDVFFLSIHGDPRHAFPYFLGHADETGHGRGEGWNVNYPLPPGTEWDTWSPALEDACVRIERAGVDALVISLGVDAYRGDPMCFFGLDPEHFTLLGARLAKMGVPTLFVMEGGYAVDRMGEVTVNVLTGFEGG